MPDMCTCRRLTVLTKEVSDTCNMEVCMASTPHLRASSADGLERDRIPALHEQRLWAAAVCESQSASRCLQLFPAGGQHATPSAKASSARVWWPPMPCLQCPQRESSLGGDVNAVCSFRLSSIMPRRLETWTLIVHMKRLGKACSTDNQCWTANWHCQGGRTHSSRSSRFLIKSTVCALMPASDLFAASSTGSRRPATDLCASTSYSCLHAIGGQSAAL